MKIAEIFSSLQGEGRTSGYPTVFVRLAGCNLSCSYCDTPASRSGGKDLPVTEVYTTVMQEKPVNICITGGEPLLQLEEVVILAERLKNTGRVVSVETNGTIPFEPLHPFATICMDVKCPSSGEESDLTLLASIRPEDSVKFVVGSDEDLAYMRDVLSRYRIQGEIFISPVHGTDYQQVASYILSNNLPARMQLQLHKCIGIP